MEIIYNKEFLARLSLSKKRMLSEEYTYPYCFTFNEKEWPGDYPGRTLLAKAMLAKAYSFDKKAQKELLVSIDDYLSHLGDFTNSGGYFGPLIDFSDINEQQISGNSWFCRALCALYELKHDKKTLAAIHKIERRLLMPLKGRYLSYVVQEISSGGIDGHTGDSHIGGWVHSSDTGCAFILLDGLSNVYEITHDPKLAKIAVDMIERFRGLNYVSLRLQTHATLSFVRGLIRFNKIAKKAEYWDLAKKVFDDYVANGSTIDNSNFNWFGRPETWTEPCAVVDSFIVASSLYEETKEEKYLSFCLRVYLNALRLAQRNNGGAGCNTCLYEENKTLKVSLYEAFFCCSMRLAEGLEKISSFFSSLPFVACLFEGEYRFDDKRFSVKGDIYSDDEITIVNEGEKDVSFVLYLHQDTSLSLGERKGSFVTIHLSKGENVIHLKKKIHSEKKVRFQGDCLLARVGNFPHGKIYKYQGESYVRLPSFLDIDEKESQDVVINV